MQETKQGVLTSDGGCFATFFVNFDESFLHDFVDLQRDIRNAVKVSFIAECLTKTHLQQVRPQVRYNIAFILLLAEHYDVLYWTMYS